MAQKQSRRSSWLEVQIPGQETQARVLLASVPKAIKSAEAETQSGLSAQSSGRLQSTRAALRGIAATYSNVGGDDNIYSGVWGDTGIKQRPQRVLDLSVQACPAKPPANRLRLCCCLGKDFIKA
jgi:hypothetical protein